MNSITGSPAMAMQIVRIKEAGRGFRSAPRVNNGPLDAMEKRVLAWFAWRMPDWVNSDHLTVLGFLGMLSAGACYAMAGHSPYFFWGASACLVVNWFGDSLDGTLARVRNRQRPRYGFYVDHIVDIFGMLALLGGMAISGYITPLVAAGVLIAFLFLAIESYLATYTLGTFHLSFGGIGPTEFRLMLILGNYFLLSRNWVTFFGMRVRLLDIAGIIAAVCMLLLMIVTAIRHTHQLYNEERLG